MHIKLIRAGYKKSPTFANKQILIRPATNNLLLTISPRTNSSEKWTFVEHLSHPLNPTDINNLGLRTQPCKSNHKNVVFNYLDIQKETVQKNS